MTRVFTAALAGMALLAAPALAESGLFIAGPKGCDLLEGWVPNDSGVGAFLQPGHWALDYTNLESWDTGCWIDGEGFSMQAVPGKVETLTGGCDIPGGGTRTGTFTLTYEDADAATLTFTGWDAPLVFTICPVR